MITSACTNHAGAVVTFTVPQSGYVVVQAQVRLSIGHRFDDTTIGADSWLVTIGASATDCNAGTWGGWAGYIPALDGGGTYYMMDFIQETFPVTAATHSFYVNGYMSATPAADDYFMDSLLVAVFYPS